MKSITIHGLDDPLDKLIREKARLYGLSLNKTIKKLLRDSLGINNRKHDNKAQFKDLFGVWSQKDLKEFEQNTKDFEKIDAEDWNEKNSS